MVEEKGKGKGNFQALNAGSLSDGKLHIIVTSKSGLRQI